MASTDFTFVADSLMRAAANVRFVAASVRDGTVEALDDAIDVGHARLGTVLSDFCARWNEGLNQAIGSNEQIAAQLSEAVAEYLAQDEEASRTFAEMQHKLDGFGL